MLAPGLIYFLRLAVAHKRSERRRATRECFMEVSHDFLLGCRHAVAVYDAESAEDDAVLAKYDEVRLDNSGYDENIAQTRAVSLGSFLKTTHRAASCTGLASRCRYRVVCGTPRSTNPLAHRALGAWAAQF